MRQSKSYPGAKTNSGIIQFLVNEIPHHVRYFEPCAGSAQLFRNKRRAQVNYLNDINNLLIAELTATFGIEGEQIRYFSVPVSQLFQMFQFTRNDFIYIDPPYPACARKSDASLYKNEMLLDADHAQLLSAVLKIDANIMISTRQNLLYDTMLVGWRKKEFNTVTHRGKAVTEVVYMNYEPPLYLHQYDMLGKDCWERQENDRKRSRFADKLHRQPPHINHMMIQEFIKHDRAAVQHFLTNCDDRIR